jgi:hypothetical protein
MLVALIDLMPQSETQHYVFTSSTSTSHQLSIAPVEILFAEGQQIEAASSACLEADGRGCTPVSITLAQAYSVLQSHYLCRASLNICGTSLTIFVHSLIIFDTLQ